MLQYKFSLKISNTFSSISDHFPSALTYRKIHFATYWKKDVGWNISFCCMTLLLMQCVLQEILNCFICIVWEAVKRWHYIFSSISLSVFHPCFLVAFVSVYISSANLLYLPISHSFLNTQLGSIASLWSSLALFQIERFHSHTYFFRRLFLISLTSFPPLAPIAGSPQSPLKVHIHCWWI